MRIAAVLCAAVLAACSVAPAPVPAALKSCARGAVVPPPPKPPRTVEAVAAWGDVAAKVAGQNRAALIECSQRLSEAVRLLRAGGGR